jgi:hypothetical protein
MIMSGTRLLRCEKVGIDVVLKQRRDKKTDASASGYGDYPDTPLNGKRQDKQVWKEK